jgi:hypothetical protein
MAVRRRSYWLLGALAVLVALPYALFGVGFVLDDWLALGNAHFDGALAAAPRDYWLNRPGQGVVWALTFGLIGEHPLVHYALQVALSAVTAMLLYRLLLRFLDQGPAFGIAALWLVVPNHGSLVRWASANMILVSLALLLGAALLLTRAEPTFRGDCAAALLLAISVLSYEATAPAAAVAALVLPRWVAGHWRWRASVVALAGTGAALAWVLVHLNPSKRGQIAATADLSRVFPAHFGWGVFPPGLVARLLVLVALAGLAVVAVRALAIGGRERRVEWLVPAGLVVIALGTLPFVRYNYEPVGVGDRLNVVAGIGTALCWYGLGRMLWQWRRPVGAAGAGVVVAAMAAFTVQGASDWHRAVRSGEQILAALPAEPEGTIVVGPGMPVTGNVAPFMDRSTIEPAVRVRLGDRSATATLTRNLPEFEAVPPALRIDVRSVAR